jgi:hypothetical protein
MAAKKDRERILIIMNRVHANRVYEAAHDYNLKSQQKPATSTESRVNAATVVALRMIFNRPQGWYDTSLRESLKKEAQTVVSPRLSHEELQKVMDNVYALIPPRDDTPELQEFRAARPQESKGKK